jgi:Probable lipid transfer
MTLRKQFFILLSIASLASCDDSSLQTKCSPEFSKLTPCLDYSTGKANAPSSDCCTSTTDLRKSNAVCLCYIIQQTHAGNANIKSLGLRFDRLLSLPSSCKMANTSLSNCPSKFRRNYFTIYL